MLRLGNEWQNSSRVRRISTGLVAMVLAISLPARAWGQQLVFQQQDTITAGQKGTEDVLKRTKDTRHFHNPDGTWTAVVGHDLNADDGKGHLVP
jgi:hypothetical protein